MVGSTRIRQLLSIFAILFIALAAIPIAAPAPAEARERFAAVTVDAHTGTILFSRNADARRYPASLTKIMTLYVLFEELKAGRLTLQSKFTVSRHAASMQPSKIGLPAGATISVENAIKALVTKSANDIAVVVAEGVSGTESAFARRMTQTARRIGMTRSQFRNASGLPNSQQVTTARDMATLGLRVQRDFPQFYHYFSLRSFTFRGRTYRTHNRLLGRYEGTNGIKTGYTRASGYNLTASVVRGRRHLVGVVMGGRSGRSRNAYMRTMLTRQFGRAPQSSSDTVARMAGTPPGFRQVAEIRDSYPLPLDKPGTENADAPVVMAGVVATPPAIEPAPAAPAQPEIAPNPESTAVPESTPAPEIIIPQPVAANAGNPFNAPAAEPPQHDPNSWAIQIGAFSSENDAIRRLDVAQDLGLSALNGRSPFTVAHFVEERVVYRARFGGFDREGAENACKLLVRKAINCFALAPNGQ